jgi:O-antigen/teichoic acid export membrane protein
MSLFKKLAQETAVYGISSIVGRALYFLLTPLYTRVIDRQLYAESVELFAYAALLMVVFTYRMETAFFRFGKDEEHRTQVFSTAGASLFYSSLLFSGVLLLFHQPIASVLGYSGKEEYIVFLGLILFFDALCELPYARLRLESKALTFAKIRLGNISLNVLLNLFFLLFCPWVLQQEGWTFLHGVIHKVYRPDWAVGYIFLSNVLASVLQFVLLLPQYKGMQWKIEGQAWKRMFLYAAPLVIASMAGVINEAFDKILLKWRLPYDMETNQSLLGEYGGAYKLTIIISLFTQAFRYSAEPFFFRNVDRVDARVIYARVSKYFSIVVFAGFLFVTAFLEVFQHLIDSSYREALKIVPVVLLANALLGIYYNFSIWYRLADKTLYGTYIALAGAAITLVLNWWWIPIFGYMGSAWATLLCYFSMVVLSYLSGRKYYPIPYPLGKMALYGLVAIALYFVSREIRSFSEISFVLQMALQTLLVLSYVGLAWKLEKRELQRV